MDSIKAVIVLSALLLQRSNAKTIPTFAGPYTLNVDRMVPCDGGRVPMNWTFALRTSHFNPYKPNEKQIISGYANLTDTLDDTAWADLRFALRANNEWKQNAFVMRFPSRVCSVFRSEAPSFFFALYKFASHTGVCLIRPGFFLMNDTVDWNFPRVKVFPYGNYMATLNVGRAGVKQRSLCIEFYAHVLPKA